MPNRTLLRLVFIASILAMESNAWAQDSALTGTGPTTVVQGTAPVFTLTVRVVTGGPVSSISVDFGAGGGGIPFGTMTGTNWDCTGGTPGICQYTGPPVSAPAQVGGSITATYANNLALGPHFVFVLLGSGGSDETNDSFQGNFVVVSAAPPTPIPTLPGAGLAALVAAIVTAVVLLRRRRVA